MIHRIAHAVRRLFAPLANHARNFVHCNRSIWLIAVAEMEMEEGR